MSSTVKEDKAKLSGEMVEVSVDKAIKDAEEEANNKKAENHLTMSTQMSTEQLICKSPRGSENSSSLTSQLKGFKEKLNSGTNKDKNNKNNNGLNVVLTTGLLQILFGFCMIGFGVLVILHNASLSQIGGGIWGGCLAVATGIVGTFASAKKLCPLKETAQKVTHTIYLALSLISLAISQLVFVVAATGLARDVNKQDNGEIEEVTKTGGEEEVPVYLAENYVILLTNLGLLVFSAAECICAAVSSYQGARAICPCFKSNEENYYYEGAISRNHQSHAIVDSWLGKHSPPPLYVVAAPSSIGKHSKLSSGLPITPVFAMSPSIIQAPSSVMPYPLIPAPLGPVPSPMIPVHPPKDMVYKSHHRKYSAREMAAIHANHCRSKAAAASSKASSKSRSKSRERDLLTNEDVARTYTGLDRLIAEEFIEICDSRNNSMCGENCPGNCQPCNCSDRDKSPCSSCSASELTPTKPNK